MTSVGYRRGGVPASLDMMGAQQYLPVRGFAQRRLSDATEIYDTDWEDTDEESLQQSNDSEPHGYYNGSSSTLSTPDLPTPDDAVNEVFDFKFGKTIEGPNGPHLFRSSIGSSIYARSTEIDLYFERSPMQPEFSKSPAGNLEIQKRYPFSPRTPKALTTIHPDVSQVEADEITSWSPSQVAHWLYIAGYEASIIENFISNDITGSVLVNLQIEDLKELNIQSFGKRHQLMTSIEHLRETVSNKRKVALKRRSGPQETSIHLTVSPNGQVLSKQGDTITPAESVSIVGIEQLLPKPHNCSKGEKCPKYQRRQRQLHQIAAEYPGTEFLPGGTAIIIGNPGNPETASNMLRPTSEAEPSVAADPSIVASSDVFGPFQPPAKLCEKSLSEIKPLDRQENVRQFLNNQHVEILPVPKVAAFANPPQNVPIPMESAAPLSPPNSQQSHHMADNLRRLPRLTIPTDSDEDELTTAQRTVTPSMSSHIDGSPITTKDRGPFYYGRYMSPADAYRQGTPFSEMDVPITAIPNGPIARETSQSVPPDMCYGTMPCPSGPARAQQTLTRSSSSRHRAGSALRKVPEDRSLTPIDFPEDLHRTPRADTLGSTQSSLTSDPNVKHSGWMKKRRTTRLLRHEWQDAHFTLRGTNLAMHKDELEAHRLSKALEVIDVDDFAVACSSLATSSKLTAAFKRSILRSANHLGHGADHAAFAFSLVPVPKDGDRKLLFGNNSKNHHFAVKTRDERIDWMRELMLAKALKKGKDGGAEVSVNGNVI